MRTEKEIQERYEELSRESSLVDGLDDRLIIYSELHMLDWVLKADRRE